MDRRDLFETSSATRTARRSSKVLPGSRPGAPGTEPSLWRSRPRETRHRYAIGILLGMCCVFGVIWPIADRGLTAGEIHAGVELGSAELGGMTLAEAREVLEADPARSVEEIEVYGPESVRFTAGEIGVRLDVERSLDDAYAVGREGGSPGKLLERARAAVLGRSLTPVISYDRVEARTRVERLVAGLEREKREATVRVRGDEAEVGEAAVGRSVDARKTVVNVEKAALEGYEEARVAVNLSEPGITTAEAEAVERRFEVAVSGPAVFFADGKEWALPAEVVGGMLDVSKQDGTIEVRLDAERARESLGEVYAELTAEPVEAGYTVREGELSVTPSQTGKEVEEEALLGRLGSGLFGGERRFEVPVTTSEPELTTDEAESQKPTTLLGRYRTNYTTYDDSPGRVENLRIASGAVNGTALASGEVFSFNELAEPLEYHETKVIIDGQVDYADGGGLCQVASTLYMAANYAGLKTVERHPHYSELPYVRPGFDATVWFGDLDLRLKNNTGSPLLFLQWVDGNGYVNAEVWGQPTGKQVEMNSGLLSTSTDAEGNPVTNWVTYRKVTRNGEVVADGPITTDTYGYLKP